MYAGDGKGQQPDLLAFLILFKPIAQVDVALVFRLDPTTISNLARAIGFCGNRSFFLKAIIAYG